ncbi:hypothetical protein B0D71_01600 [Pseudomonas laurylsulfativorans]|uniref:Uncharacterized protein n=1 Tax=Pseudomonas laurylsulfativorans TaxID=1943631 RepID=A0A2S3VUE0_9PSED|nr:hypothetical protein [Pseudomonas laurylsulfativorans]POF43533.1 hypothetical protein B0D71_01600 [Pseudomonas laurylsulfativorans]
MKRATPPCSSIALLPRSSPPCALPFTLTTINAAALDDFGTEKTDPKLPAPTSYALVVCAHPGTEISRLHRPSTEHHPDIRHPVGGSITSRQRAVHLASDPDVRLLDLFGIPRKSEN